METRTYQIKSNKRNEETFANLNLAATHLVSFGKKLNVAHGKDDSVQQGILCQTSLPPFENPQRKKKKTEPQKLTIAPLAQQPKVKTNSTPTVSPFFYKFLSILPFPLYPLALPEHQKPKYPMKKETFEVREEL